ncbi:MAG: CheY-like chemotaxis protein [Granulosicoccus sp.]|jgi:CheY-like chemotaxis protein
MSKKVFVVDDDNMYRRMLEQRLTVAGFEVVGFATGEECLANSQLPDLVVVDYYLNSENADAMNGLATIERLRARLPELPAVVLSGRADLTSSSNTERLSHLLRSGDRKALIEAFREGAFFYLMKSNDTNSTIGTVVKGLLG